MTKYYLVFVLSFLSTFTASLHAGGDCLSGNCVNGKGFAKYGEDQYIGDFKYSKPSGNGSYIWKDGTVYMGDFENGVPHGKGEYIWPDGKKYTGEFKNGQPGGKGTLTYKNGESYEGIFEDGVLVQATDLAKKEALAQKGDSAKIPSIADPYSSSSAKSESKNCISGNCKDGQGTVMYGHQYIGDFQNQYFNGKGTYIWPDGSTYSGEFKDGRPHGQGSFTGPDGTNYIGEFKFGLPNGAGKFSDKEGNIYEGDFEKGLLVNPKKKIADNKEKEKYIAKGKPKVSSVDENVIHPDSRKAEEDFYASREPFWKKKFAWPFGSRKSDSSKTPIAKKVNCLSGDCVNGKGTAKYDQDQYAGDFKNRYFNGKGIYTWPDGSVYIGDFKDGRPHGQGTYRKPDGTNYVGDFKFGLPDGKGKLTSKDGKTYEGDFEKGVLVKPKNAIANKKEKEKYIADGKTKVEPVNKDAISPKSIQEEEKHARSTTPFWKRGILKSAIIPGWTQWENGEKLKGGIFFGSFFLTAGLLYQWDKTYHTRKDDYNRSANTIWLYPNDMGAVGIGFLGVKHNLDNYRQVGGEARKLSIGLVAIYLINVVDAMFFSKPAKTAFQQSEGFHFYTEQYRFDSHFSDSTFNVQYVWRF